MAVSGFREVSGNDMYKHVRRTRIMGDQEIGDLPRDADFHSIKADDVKARVGDGEGCRVHGVVNVWKLMGSFAFSTERGTFLLQNWA